MHMLVERGQGFDVFGQTAVRPGLLNAALGGATFASKAKNSLSNILYYLCDRLLVSLFSELIWSEEGKFQHIPGPAKSNYFFGHVLDLKHAMESEDMMIQDLLYDWAQRFGLTFKVFIFHKAVIVTAHPAGVKEALLGGHPKADELYSCLVNLYGVRFLGTGLVTLTNHELWDHRRKAMDPAFRRQFLKGLMEQFNSTSDILIEKLHRYADGKTSVSMLEEFHRITLDLIGKVAFSMDINSIHDDSSPFPSAVRAILEAMYAQLFKGDFGLNPFKRGFYKRSREAVMFLRNVGQTLIESRAEAMLRGEEIPDDILTHAIKLSASDPQLTIESMLDDFISFFIAGHETTANTLSFIVLELGRRPHVLERLREEISTVVGEERYLKYEHISNLKYMNMVMKESMRLYPTAPSTFRKLNKTSNIGGYLIPESTIVMVSDYVASRNPGIFVDPLDFRPERFDTNAKDKVPIYSCFPFSLGPRSCIGKTFAQIQTKVILTKFLMDFDFTLVPNQSFEMKEVATLKPKSNVDCVLSSRNDLYSSAYTKEIIKRLSDKTERGENEDSLSEESA